MIGCYTLGERGSGAGLVVTERDPDTGELWLAGPTLAVPSPSFVVRHPSLPVLYAVNEQADGALSAVALDRGGNVKPLGDYTPAHGAALPSWATGGADPCHLAASPDGRWVVVANHHGGTVAVLGLDTQGIPTGRTDLGAASPASRPHHVTVNGAEVLVVDLGLDAIVRYRLDEETGTLTAHDVAVRFPPGTGPRHAARSPSGSTVYVVGEDSGTVTVLRPGPGAWDELGTVPSRTSAGAHNLPSEVAISADGRWLYVANRGPDTIAVFALDSELPRLVGEVPTGGSWPRHFALAGEHLYVANQRSHTVTVFHIDADTGLPTPAGDVFASPSPTCLLFVDS